MSKTPTSTIASALTTGPAKTVATKVRNALKSDGWKVVQARKVARLEEVLNEIYVDNRRQRQVELLEEARKLTQSL